MIDVSTALILLSAFAFWYWHTRVNRDNKSAKQRLRFLILAWAVLVVGQTVRFLLFNTGSERFWLCMERKIDEHTCVIYEIIYPLRFLLFLVYMWFMVDSWAIRIFGFRIHHHIVGALSFLFACFLFNYALPRLAQLLGFDWWLYNDILYNPFARYGILYRAYSSIVY